MENQKLTWTELKVPPFHSFQGDNVYSKDINIDRNGAGSSVVIAGTDEILAVEN
jgi:hypothetical protein